MNELDLQHLLNQIQINQTLIVFYFQFIGFFSGWWCLMYVKGDLCVDNYSVLQMYGPIAGASKCNSSLSQVLLRIDNVKHSIWLIEQMS